MKPEELLQSVTELVEGLRADMAKQCDKMDAIEKKADAIIQSRGVGARRMDNDDDGDDPTRTMAMRTAADAADAAANNAVMIRGLASSIADLKKKQARPMSDLNQFADAQAKADSVMRALGSAAEPPMAAEDLIAYRIRMHRKMQPHSPRWKGVDLQLIAADQVALDNVMNEIRADAIEASKSTVGMPEFQHRMITKTMPGGHQSTEFVGNGTIFKQMSRPVRYVQRIGPRWGGAGA